MEEKDLFEQLESKLADSFQDDELIDDDDLLDDGVEINETEPKSVEETEKNLKMESEVEAETFDSEEALKTEDVSKVEETSENEEAEKTEETTEKEVQKAEETPKADETPDNSETIDATEKKTLLEKSNISDKTKSLIAAFKTFSNKKIIFVLSTLLCAIVFIATLFSLGKTYSENENRALAQLPAFSSEKIMSGDYFNDLSDYYNDHFAGRDTWISLKFTEDRISGYKETNDVIVGKDGYLIGKSAAPDENVYQKYAQSISTFKGNHPDMALYMMVVPNAASVNPEILPANAPYRNQNDDIEALETALGGLVNFTNAGDSLKNHTDEQLFYRTDHHWTGLGAKYAFLDNAAALGIEKPVTEYEEYFVSDTFKGTLASKAGCSGIRDNIEIIVPKSDIEYYVNYPDLDLSKATLFMPEKLEEKDQYTVFMGGNHPLAEIYTGAMTERNLLVFKDSYANSFIQFLTPYYDTITLVDPRYYYNSIEPIITEKGITDVFFLYSADTLAQDQGLCDTLGA